MMKRVVVAMLLLAGLGPLGSLVNAASLPMPPVFSRDALVEVTLQSYPLGVITRQAAFSHHGKAHRNVTLPNGMEGWVYDVGGVVTTSSYVSPTGRKQAVAETAADHEARSYTLVFDQRGVVIDVLYNETGRHDGLTALALQHRKGAGRREDPSHTDPGR